MPLRHDMRGQRTVCCAGRQVRSAERRSGSIGRWLRRGARRDPALRPEVAARGHRRRDHAGGARDPRGDGLRADRRDAGDHRALHDAGPGRRLRAVRVVAASGGRCRLCHRRDHVRGDRRPRHLRPGAGLAAMGRTGRSERTAGRRDAVAGALRRSGLPGRLHVAHGAGRLPDRRRHPGCGRPGRRDARNPQAVGRRAVLQRHVGRPRQDARAHRRGLVADGARLRLGDRCVRLLRAPDQGDPRRPRRGGGVDRVSAGLWT